MRRITMSGRKLSALIAFMTIGAVLFGPVPGRAQEIEPAGIRVRPSLGIEHFSRTISWDEGASTSTLIVSMAALRVEAEFQTAGRLGFFAGYGFSNYDGLIFRQLPFSLEYQAGNIGSLIWGADLEGRILSLGDYEIGIAAQFTMSLGRTKEFAIPGLNASGSLDGKGSWSRILAGPVIRYTGYEKFTPFFSVSYNRMWGTFTMNESIGELSGFEEKKIAGKGSIGFTIGTVYEPSAAFKLKAEITAVPFKKLEGGLDTDYGASIKAIVSF